MGGLAPSTSWEGMPPARIDEAGQPSSNGLMARIARCYDGDTCYADLHWDGDPLPPLFGKNMKVRLLGIDTPEIKGAGCERERCLARRAKALLEDFVSRDGEQRLESCVRDKYFRVTCDIVSARGESASKAMLASGLAVEYGGKTKVHDWCASTAESPPLRRHIEACAD